MKRKMQFLFRRSRVESEIDQELQFHIEAHIARNVAAGVPMEEARYRAMQEFGALETVKEEMRDTRGMGLIDSLAQDVRFGWRLLTRRPGFTLTAILTLALGIGVNVSLFSVINAVLLRPLPYADPDRLVQLWNYRDRSMPRQEIPLTPGDFLDFREQTKMLEGLAAYGDFGVSWTGFGEPERLTAARVTARFFELLGVEPVLGRRFAGERERTALISHALWTSRFASDRGVIGRPMTLEGQPHTIIGVLPKEFHFAGTGTIDVWVPWHIREEARGDRYSHFLLVIGRLKPGVTMPQAQAEQSAIAKGIAEANPDTNKGWYARLRSMRDDFVGDVRPALWILLAAVTVVLAIACANVANLLIAQSVAREREMAIRIALGAGRWRIVRQLLVEGWLLSATGAALGLLLAIWAVPLAINGLPEVLRRYMTYLSQVAFDGRVIAFTIALTVMTTLAAALAPAIQAARHGSLRTQSRETARGNRMRGVLVAAEAALAAILIVSAGLALRSLQKMMSVSPGFETVNALTMQVALPAAKYREPARQVSAQKEIIARLGLLPGMSSVATTSVIPLSGANRMSAFNIVGREDPAWKMPSCDYWTISPQYFATMGIPLKKGRVFTAQDEANTAKVILINQTLARDFFSNEDPIGKRIVVGRVSLEPREIVGVAGDVRGLGLDIPIRPAIYLPAAQDPMRSFSVLARASGDPRSLGRPVRAALLEIEPDMTVYGMNTLEQVMTGSPTLAIRRTPSLAMTMLAVAALLLAAVGIAGLLSSVVNQRTREIGVRMALGANAGSVIWMVLRQSLQLMAVGVAVGLVAAASLSRIARSWVFGVGVLDAVSYVGAALLLALVALAAAGLPAHRATRVDPASALRCD
jgi:putative ABC transport system permease protein